MQTYFILKLFPWMIFLSFEIIYFYPKFYLWAFIIANLLIIYAVARVLKNRARAKEYWFAFILPIIFPNSALFFSFLLDKKYIHLFILLSAIFIHYYFRQIYDYFYQEGEKDSWKIGNFTYYSGLLSFFFTASIVYGLQSYLNISVAKLIFLIIAVCFLVSFQYLKFYQIPFRESALYLFISCVIMTEIGWIGSFFPLKFFITGAIVSIIYYLVSGLLKFYLLGKLNKIIIRNHILVGLLSLIIILLTSRWV